MFFTPQSYDTTASIQFQPTGNNEKCYFWLHGTLTKMESILDIYGAVCIIVIWTIGSLENGRYNPSIVLAFKIARYFGMSIEDIFIYEEEKL